MGDVFLKLLNMSITAGWVIVAVLCVRLMFRNIPKWIYCALWGVVAIRLIVPFSFESTFSLQPVDSAQNFLDTFLIYHDPVRGPAYIEDALRRGLVLNTPEEPYLSVYSISGNYGEITENIPLTEKEALKILSEDKMKLTEGCGFAAVLSVNGETEFYFENSVPQSVVDLAVEKCGYQFATPESISAPIREASLVCGWLEEPILLDKAYLAQLEEILKSAEFTGVGNCGYSATLILTLQNGECMTVFKGTDDCGSFVFGSYGGYSISDEADDAFWEMFGLSADAEGRLNLGNK